MLLLTCAGCARIDGGQRSVRHQRADGKKHRARGGAAGDEVYVPGAQRRPLAGVRAARLVEVVMRESVAERPAVRTVVDALHATIAETTGLPRPARS